MTHVTTLVVDFDDTLAITLNRDWENAAPNQPLIEKLNALFDQGWTIHIVTARGQLSCNGDSEAADKKYRAQIEKWLKDHNVSYSSLSFQKKLAAYYIDDKGITPEDFVASFDREELKGGWSGASVYYDKHADAVFKTAKNTPSVIEWFEYAFQRGFSVPEVYSVIGNTIKMECLYKFSTGTLKDLIWECSEFNEFSPIHPGVTKKSYVDRCLGRVEGHFEDILQGLRDTISWAMLHTPETFSHGDFSISNVMENSDGEIVFIDPINDPTLYSSWVIDLGKLYTTVNSQYREMFKDVFEEHLTLYSYLPRVPFDVIRAHEIGHLCRMIPYAPEGKVDELKQRVREIYKSFL